MRPNNTNRNSEQLSQPVSSAENSLAEKTLSSNSSFDIWRSLTESISVDCGFFEIASPTECSQSTYTSSHVEFVDPKGKEIRTPVEFVPPTPVSREPAQTPIKPFDNAAASDMDDDDYDCMNDPNYRSQGVKETDSPTFEELMARTAESIAKMREETQAANSKSGNDDRHDKRSFAEPAQPQKQEEKPSIDPQSGSSAKKGAFSWLNLGKVRKMLFSRETIKLFFLSIAISALMASAIIYRNSSRNNNGLMDTDCVVIDQSPSENQDVSVQGNSGNSNNSEFKDSVNEGYWTLEDKENWDSSVAPSPQALTDQIRDDYQSPSFDTESNEYKYSQNGLKGNSNLEDAGRQLAPPHNSNNGNQCVAARANGEAPFPNRATARLTEPAPVGRFDSRNSQLATPNSHSGTDLVGFVETIPVYNSDPQYADVSPAIGAQYSPDEYESPVLEDDTVSGYSETGYNSNFMR